MATPPTRIAPKPPGLSLAAKAFDLDALRTAVDDAARASGPLWVSYILALFYFLVAAGGVTHKDMFLERPVKLPFLGVDLPIVGFFVVAPPVFVLLHAYVLLHFVMLTGKVAAYDTALQAQVPGPSVRQALRRQLPANLFVQFLAGPRDIRQGTSGVLLRTVAVISLTVGPVGLLVFLQMQFLPFHAAWVTWTQRGALLADLSLLWSLWRRLGPFNDAEYIWRFRPLKMSVSRWASLIGSLFALWLAFLIGTFPGELLDQYARRLPLREYLIDGAGAAPGLKGIDYAKNGPSTLFANRIILPDFDISGEPRFDSKEKLAWARTTLRLRNRDFRGAWLNGANLQKVDLAYAELEGASLNHTQLQDASLDDAKLQGAYLAWAQLQGASLFNDRLQGATLIFADLRGANFVSAKMQGADLDFAQLQGAFLDDAQLQGASLNYAELQGASLSTTNFQGASLDSTRFVGVSLRTSDFSFSSLRNPYVWRTDAPDWNNIKTWLTSPRPNNGDGNFNWTKTNQEKLEKILVNWGQDDFRRETALENIKILANLDRTSEDNERAEQWRILANRAMPTNKETVAALRDLGCVGESAPYLVIGLIKNFIESTPDRPKTTLSPSTQRDLARAFLAPGCDAAKSIGDHTRTILTTAANWHPSHPGDPPH